MAAAIEPAAQKAGQFVDWITLPSVAKRVERGSGLMPVLAEIVAGYVQQIGVFGPNFWRSVGVDAGTVREIDPAFSEFWEGPDPVDPTQRVYSTHHPPVWIPKGLTLATVEEAGLQFDPNDTEGLRVYRNRPVPGGYYAVMRKEVRGRNLSEDDQIQQLKRAGYPGFPLAADVAAVILALHQYDGTRWLGDDTGAENRWTYTRCIERVQLCPPTTLAIGGFWRPGVSVDYEFRKEYYNKNGSLGVVGFRMF